MPVYEGFGIGVERAAVVLDIGSAYTKCGFSGEASPRFIIPSKSENLITKKTVDIWSVGPSDVADALLDFIYHIYFRLLSITPRERRVVVCESLVCPHYFRQALANVLFKHFEAPSMLYLPTQQLPLYSLGVQTALVVDVGHSETSIIPFVEGIPLLGSWQSVAMGAQTVHRRVNEMVMEMCSLTHTAGGTTTSPLTLKGGLSSAILEDITVRTCFVRGPPSSEEASESTAVQVPASVDYPLDEDKTVIIHGRVRSDAADVWFTDDIEGSCLPRAVLDAIAKAPVDCRRLLAENLVIVGGTSQLPGFRYRFVKELGVWVKKECFSSQLSVSCFKLHENTVPANVMAWVGASVYSATGVLKERSLSRDTFQEKGKLPDWTSCDPELSSADALSWQKKRSVYTLPTSVQPKST